MIRFAVAGAAAGLACGLVVTVGRAAGWLFRMYLLGRAFSRPCSAGLR